MDNKLRGYKSDSRCGCCGKFSRGTLYVDITHKKVYSHICKECGEVWNVIYEEMEDTA